MVVDTFPILDGIAIATFDRADEVWHVVAPTVPTVLGAERLNKLLPNLGQPKGDLDRLIDQTDELIEETKKRAKKLMGE